MMPKPKFNALMDVCSLEILEQACETVSGFCHRFEVEAKKTTCEITYSNPDEYAVEHPMTAVFPMFTDPDCFGYRVQYVVNYVLRVKKDSWDGEGWQVFVSIWDEVDRIRRGVYAGEMTTEDPQQS